MALPSFLSRALAFLIPPVADNRREMPVYAPVSRVQKLTPEDPFQIQERVSVMHTARGLYKTDGRYQAVIDTFVESVVRAGFSFDSEEADPVRMKELSEEYRLPQQLGMWLRNLFLDGNLFLLIEAKNGRITGFYPLPAAHMVRNSDGYDAFPNPNAAFTMLRSQEVAAEYAVQDYQIATGGDGDFKATEVLHVRWMRTEGRQRYGVPLLAAVHNALQRAVRAEANLDIRRQTHGALRLWHRFLQPVTPEEQKNYIAKQMQDAKDLNSPLYQHFTNAEVEISVIPGDSHLHEFGDAQYQLEAFWSGCPVPKSVLGYADNVNRDIFAVQQQQYQSRLESVSEFVSQEILTPIMSVLLMNDGQLLTPDEITCAFGSRAVFDASAFQSVADALSKLPAGVLAREDATRLLATQLDRDPEELLDNVSSQEMNDSMLMEPSDPPNPELAATNDMTL